MDTNNKDSRVDPSLNNMPDVTTDRESAGSKSIKIMAIGVIVILIILIAAGLTFNRYNANKKIRKQQEAEQALLDKKEVSISNSQVDLGSGIDNLAFDDMNALTDSENQLANAPTDLLAEQPLVIPLTPSTTAPKTTQNRFKPIPPPQLIPSNPGATPQVPDYSALTKSLDNIGKVNTAIPTYPVVEADTSPAPVPAPPPPLTPLQQKLLRIADSDVMAFEGKARAASSENNEAASNEDIKSFSDRFTASEMVDGVARQRGDTSLLLSKGTSIPCVLKTKIVSDYQGFTICQVSQDVYSANGKVLLIDRGSSVIGEQSMAVEEGKVSVFVLWTTLETPNGVSVNLSSPATGPLGEMGIPAGIKTHFWKRFGSAIMLSFIEDAISVASQNARHQDDKGSNNTFIDSAEERSESIAEKALEATIDLPPTAIVNQGALLNILVVRDIDFEGVYEYN